MVFRPWWLAHRAGKRGEGGIVGHFDKGWWKGAFEFGEAGAKVEENQTTNTKHATSFPLRFLVYSKHLLLFYNHSILTYSNDASLII